MRVVNRLTDRYIGIFNWEYRINGKVGFIELERPTSNRREDEFMVRLHLRKKFGMKRLPKKTKVTPVLPIS